MFRRLPDTDVGRTNALDTPYLKWPDTLQSARPLTQAEFDAMIAVRTPWKAAINAAASAQSLQNKAVAQAEAAVEVLEKNISGFIQVFNLAVDRGYFLASDRAFYKLPSTSAATPPITSHNDRLNWAHNIIDGEAMRATAEGPGTPATLDSGLRLDEGVHADSLVGGYKPMAMPTVGEVATALAAYEAAHKVASDAKDAYEAAQLVVQGLRPAVDAQIVELWDAIEYFFRHLEPSTLRRSAREWGVVYASRSGDPEDPTPPTPPPPTP